MESSNSKNKYKQLAGVAILGFVLMLGFGNAALAGDTTPTVIIIHGYRIGPDSASILRVRFPQMFEGGFNWDSKSGEAAFSAIRLARAECRANADKAVQKCQSAVLAGGVFMGSSFCLAVGSVMTVGLPPLGVAFLGIGLDALV